MGKRNRGQVLVMFVLALFILVGFVALGIDVGYMYSVRNDLQRSADAGALAGAFAFHDGGWVSGPVPALLQAKAENRARYFATRDPVGAAPLDNGAITFTNPYPGVNQIEVTAQTNLNLFFAGAIGFPTVALSATARAEAIPVDQNVECLTPLAFPYPYLDSSPPNHKWDSWEPFVPISQGLQVTFRVADTFSPIPAYVQNWAGEIFPLLICGDSPSEYDDRIRNPCGEPCPTLVSLSDSVNPKNDPTYMPTIDPIYKEFLDPVTGEDPFASWVGSPVNLPSSPDPRYSSDNWMRSPRVMRVMLYDPQIARTTGVIVVERFAGFWVDSVDYPPTGSNRSMTGYLVPDSAVGNSSVSPLLIAPSLKTTRLVQ